MTIAADRLTAAVDALAPPGRPVMVHSALRSFGEPLDGGADALLDALLAGGRTVLVPAFTWAFFGAPAPEHLRPERNGVDYAPAPPPPPGTPPLYHPDCGLIDPNMGALPATLLTRPGARRGAHPVESFAALGPEAAELIDGQRSFDVYAPIRAVAERGGTVLLVGVGLRRMTLLHLAEQRAGRTLFIRWVHAPDGRIVTAEGGSCSDGFPRLAPALSPHERTTEVGASRWTAYPAAEALSTAAAAIRADQSVTHCGSPDCPECRDATRGGPTGPLSTPWRPPGSART